MSNQELTELDAEIVAARLRLQNAQSNAQAEAYWLDLRDLEAVRASIAPHYAGMTIEEELARR